MFIFWKIPINSNENCKRKLIISTQSVICVVRHLLVCSDHEIHTCARSYASLGWISWKFMHFSWTDDSPLWILCVSWCQIERAARLRLRKVLHLHAIRDSKTWIRVIRKLPNSEQSYKEKVKTHKYINRQNQSTTGNDSDKTSMTAGNYGKQLCLKNLDCI